MADGAIRKVLLLNLWLLLLLAGYGAAVQTTLWLGLEILAAGAPARDILAGLTGSGTNGP